MNFLNTILYTRIHETGTVQRLTTSHITVLVSRHARTDGCKGCTACAMPTNSRSLELPLPSDTTFACGDRVRVERTVINEACAAGILFGLPLLLAAGTLFMFHYLAPWYSLDHPTPVFTSVGALLAGVGLGSAIDRLFRHTVPVPHLLRADPSCTC